MENNKKKSFFLSEDERKFKFDSIEKYELFPKEVLVLQWYDIEDAELETKFIIRLHNGTSSWCRIRKKRTSDVHADKTIEYIDNVPLQELLDKPFLCKRRSVIGNIYVDRFIVNDGICVNMLENEGDDKELGQFVGCYHVKGLEEVTSNVNYHSRNMAIPFSMNHLVELQLFIKNFSIQNR